MSGIGPQSRVWVQNFNEMPASGGGSSVPTGPAGTPNAAVVSVQGVANGTPQPVSQSGAWIVQVTDGGGPITVDGTVNIGNFPATQPISGSVSLAPNASAANGIVPVRATGVATLQIKAAAGNLYSAYAVAGNTGFILIALDRATALASGAAISAAEIINMAPISSNGFASISPTDVPDRFVNGCLLIASTSMTTYTPPSPLPLFMRGKAV